MTCAALGALLVAGGGLAGLVAGAAAGWTLGRLPGAFTTLQNRRVVDALQARQEELAELDATDPYRMGFAEGVEVAVVAEREA